MKPNEAPEKIYLEKVYPDNGVLPNGLNYNQSPNEVEYTRTDAFIEKVESCLNRKDDRDSYTIGYIKRHLKEIIKEVGL